MMKARSGLAPRSAACIATTNPVLRTIPTSHERILPGLTEDNEGNIWVGTFGGGLDRIRRRVIALEDTESGLPFASVQSICEASDGTIWAVTQNGVLVQRIDGQMEFHSDHRRIAG